MSATIKTADMPELPVAWRKRHYNSAGDFISHSYTDSLDNVPEWDRCNLEPLFGRQCASLAAEQAEGEKASALTERLKMEAQIHAQEARTANATIAEIYRIVTEGTGEPGNWNGAEPVRQCIEDLRTRLAALTPEPAALPAEVEGESETDSCPHGDAHIVHDCLRCGAPVCCDKCCAEDSMEKHTVCNSIPSTSEPHPAWCSGGCCNPPEALPSEVADELATFKARFSRYDLRPSVTRVGHFNDLRVEHMWDAWQSRAALATPIAAQPAAAEPEDAVSASEQHKRVIAAYLKLSDLHTYNGRNHDTTIAARAEFYSELADLAMRAAAPAQAAAVPEGAEAEPAQAVDKDAARYRWLFEADMTEYGMSIETLEACMAMKSRVKAKADKAIDVAIESIDRRAE